jgi:hypothetical protein
MGIELYRSTETRDGKQKWADKTFIRNRFRTDNDYPRRITGSVFESLLR